jgi:hypothetical protein
MPSRRTTVAALAIALAGESGAADAKENRAAYVACVEYHFQMFRLCQCQFDAGFCDQTFASFARLRCARLKGLSDPRSFYGSCLPKLKHATCATPRRSFMDAPQSCADQFVQYAPGDVPNPWGEATRQRSKPAPPPFVWPKSDAPLPKKDEETPTPAPTATVPTGAETASVPSPFLDPWSTDGSSTSQSEDTDEWPDVAAADMMATKLAGTAPRLPDAVKAQRRGSEVEGSYRLCVAASGQVSTAAPLKSIPGADEGIIATLLKWTFKPPAKAGCFKTTFQFHVE